MNGIQTDLTFLILIGAIVLIAVFIIHGSMKASGGGRK
jgi:hypothetical protein